MRNFFEGDELLDFIIEDDGGRFEAVLEKLLVGDYDVFREYGDMQYDQYAKKLQEHGPAIVKMFVGPDFYKDHVYVYEGKPHAYEDKKKEGHTMNLVAVLRNRNDLASFIDGTDIYFLLQNSWRKKQFVLVRRDYFRACSLSSRDDLKDPNDGRTSINFVEYHGEFKCANAKSIYAKKAAHDVSLSA